MENDWRRYSCQMALPGFDENAQHRLREGNVLIVGVGGLGCPASQYLVSSGIGQITIADNDVVSLSNLHRQILFGTDDIGKSKAIVACEKLQLMNEDVKLIALNERVTSDNVMHLVGQSDVIIDCTDNIETKYLLNDACVMAGKPLVYGAIYQFEGQVAVWNVKNSDGSMSPNYRDLFPEINSAAIPSCAEGGVLPGVAGVIGCMQASEVVKLIANVGEVLSGKLFLFDGSSSTSRIINIGKNSNVKITEIVETNTCRFISANKLSVLIERNELQLIDVREGDERTEFNIGGMHVPLSTIENISFENEKQVVIYCQSGRRSEHAANIISKKFPHIEVYSLEGGMKSWKEMLSSITL